MPVAMATGETQQAASVQRGISRGLPLHRHVAEGELGRRFRDRGYGMTWKGGATPHPLRTLCTIH